MQMLRTSPAPSLETVREGLLLVMHASGHLCTQRCATILVSTLAVPKTSSCFLHRQYTSNFPTFLSVTSPNHYIFLPLFLSSHFLFKAVYLSWIPPSPLTEESPFLSWPGGSLGWRVVPYTKGWHARFLVRAQTWIADLDPWSEHVQEVGNW